MRNRLIITLLLLVFINTLNTAWAFQDSFLIYEETTISYKYSRYSLIDGNVFISYQNENNEKTKAENLLQYELRKKSPAAAIGLDFLIPFVGCIYGKSGWCAMSDLFGIIFLLGYAVSGCNEYDEHGECSSWTGSQDKDPKLLGFGMVLRVVGMISAYFGADNYNKKLRNELGLEAYIVPQKDKITAQLAYKF